MNFELSNKFKKKARSYMMSQPTYLIYACLRASGVSIEDAWNITFNNAGAAWTPVRLSSEQGKLEGLASVQNAIKDIQKEHAHSSGVDEHTGSIDPELLAKETSKEKILSDLIVARSKVRPSSKEWVELTKLLGDYARIKQDDIDNGKERTIHFYVPTSVPLSCGSCPLYLNGKNTIKLK